jgi:hypothetical protein
MHKQDRGQMHWHPARVFGHIRARQAVDQIRIIQIIRIDRARAAIGGPTWAAPCPFAIRETMRINAQNMLGDRHVLTAYGS